MQWIRRGACFAFMATALARTSGVFAAAADWKPGETISVRSPNEAVVVTFALRSPSNGRGGGPAYQLSYRGKQIIGESPLGVTLQQGGAFVGLGVVELRRDSGDETYPVVAGKTSSARNHFNEATIALCERGKGKDGRTIEIVLRAYDDGMAFRYQFPTQTGLTEFAITSEDSGFSPPTDATAWILPVPNYTSHYEYLYQKKKVREIEGGKLFALPLLLELSSGGPALAITEANLTDYAGMYLAWDAGKDADREDPAASNRVLRAALAPLPDQKEVKVRAVAPHTSPWRVIMIGDTAGSLIESNLVMNLNEPCALPDTSWIKPGKVAFLWWNGYLVGRNGRRGGVDTATFKHYIDGAAEFGFAYSSIDGLETAWYGGKIPGYGEHDITVPVKELDMPKVLAYAKTKGVRIRLWVASAGLRKYLDKALATYEQWGVEGIMVDFIERDDQEMIQWIHEMVQKAAKHHLTVTLHNVAKPTGLSRKYPNLLTFEAVRNQEWNKWDPLGSTPEHQLTVPFTRMLAGPLDFHSGGFRSVRAADYAPRDVAPDVMGTRCHQLAMYVVYENPMPMAVDYPAAYRGRPGVEFLSAVPTTWDETHVIDGKVGDYIIVARRKGEDWYVGSMTDQTPRELQIPLTFLAPGRFTAETWCDNDAAGPNAVRLETLKVTATATLQAKLGASGGQVVRIKPMPAAAERGLHSGNRGS